MKKLFLFIAICFVLATANSDAQFGGGIGTASSPFQLNNFQHLNDLYSYVSSSFINAD